MCVLDNIHMILNNFVYFILFCFQNLEVLSLTRFCMSLSLLVDLCEIMTNMKDLNLAYTLPTPACDKVFTAISVSMPRLQKLNIAGCCVSLSALECLLPTEDNPRRGCPDLQILNLNCVPDITVEFLKKIIICLPKLQCLRNGLMIAALAEVTDEELGINFGRCLEHFHLYVPKKWSDRHILQNAPVFATECNVTHIDIHVVERSIVFTKEALIPLKKIKSISMHAVLKSADSYLSLLKSKRDGLEFLHLTNSPETVSLGDIIRTCPNLKELSVGYVSSTVESATDADSEYQKEEQIERSVLPCLKKIDLYKVSKELCSSETLISLLRCPQLEEITLTCIQAMSNDVMFKVLSSSPPSLSQVKYFKLDRCPLVTAASFVQWLSMETIALEDLHIKDCDMDDEDVLHAAVEKYPRPLNVTVRPISFIEFPRYQGTAQGPCVENCHCCAYKRLKRLKTANS